MDESSINRFQASEHQQRSKLSFFPLVALIFYEVSGGPFGVEDSVRAAGPLLAILGFIIFPFLWSVPEALITAELATAFPANGGYVLWISAAFGPFWGFQEGFWKWLSGVIDNALYPVLFLDYIKRSVPVFATAAARYPTLAILTALLTFVNYRGLTIVGLAAILLAFFSLLPFAIMGILALPRIKPRRWIVVSIRETQWRGYLNSLFWNLNFWDKASTLAGEIERPSETFPRALFAAVLLVVISYIIPLLAGTGVLDLHREDWEDGYFADIGREIGGQWLKWWINSAAALSNMGLFEAEMSSDSFQLLGMAEIGMLPRIFARRSKHGTPVLGILCSATGVVLLSWMTFQEIVELLNFLYCVGMLLEFAAFIWLRVKRPDLHRPFKLQLGTLGVVMFCLPPSAFLVLVMCLASMRTIFVSCGVAAVGIVLYPAIMFVKSKKWVEFAVDTEIIAPPPPPEQDHGGQQQQQLIQLVPDDRGGDQHRELRGQVS
ncbi:probable polyamine transporter At3g19553 isoform X1 [Selaginella moellendorffii]|uniref:probable polyamine transporter At3g19553 isoform X1 n=1 Tax=Selaginella moellendorffii TaxID=88036 RepID=UPI000D1C237B|nr:probable polyamine transporter At3g19553 isoform X1 [Selaginella moellendorffii]|eukprot:XP_024540259.1 probable polyamine transporter At3g19553 isoform X1 [Selaginella moellendorffii]